MSHTHVEAVVADTAAARRIHYQLRYRVFCLQTGFEDPILFPEKEEKDEFDGRSVHFLVRDRRSGAWLAAARLVLPGGGTLPVEQHCGLSRDEVYSTYTLPFERTAEVSRLLMATGVRPRRQDLRSSGGDGGEQHGASRSASRERPATPIILTDLLLAIAAYCREHAVPQAAFLVTPALARILRRLGIALINIGEPCQHRGKRLACVAGIEQVYQALRRRNHEDPNRARERRLYTLYSELECACELAQVG
jgi:N-acyl amino acid synthase of PEP-CTERM/exosortase system